MHTTNDNTEKHFQDWLKAVDRLCLAKFMLRLADLADMATRDAFDAGVEPVVFFEETVVPTLREDYGDIIDRL